VPVVTGFVARTICLPVCQSVLSASDDLFLCKSGWSYPAAVWDGEWGGPRDSL